MKVALCISGHLRDGDKLTYPALKKFMLDKYDCDVFISSWKESGTGIQYVHQEITPTIFENVEERILKTYEPMRGNFDIENASDMCVARVEKRWKGILTRNGSQLAQNNLMFRKIYLADHLRRMYELETGTKYDVVIRLRFDTELLCDIIEPSIDNIKNGSVVVRSGHCGIIDQLFWGKPDVVTAASECFLYVPDLVNASNSYNFENAENIFQNYLGARGIPYIRRDDIKFSLTKPHGGHIV